MIREFDCIKFTQYCPIRDLNVTLQRCVDGVASEINYPPPWMVDQSIPISAYIGDFIEYNFIYSSALLVESKLIIRGAFRYTNNSTNNYIWPSSRSLTFFTFNMSSLGNISVNVYLDNGNSISVNTTRVVLFTGYIPTSIGQCNPSIKYINMFIPAVAGNPSIDYRYEIRPEEHPQEPTMCDLADCKCETTTAYIVLGNTIVQEFNITDSNVIGNRVDYSVIVGDVNEDGEVIAPSNNVQSHDIALKSASDLCGNTVCNKSYSLVKIEAASPTAVITLNHHNFIIDNWCVAQEVTISNSCNTKYVKYEISLGNTSITKYCKSVTITPSIVGATANTPDKSFTMELYRSDGIIDEIIYSHSLLATAGVFPPDPIIIPDANLVNVVVGDTLYVVFKWNSTTYEISVCVAPTDGVEIKSTKIGSVEVCSCNNVYLTNTTLQSDIVGITPSCPSNNVCDDYVIANTILEYVGEPVRTGCDSTLSGGIQINDLISALFTPQGFTNLNDIIPKNGNGSNQYDQLKLTFLFDATTSISPLCNTFTVTNTNGDPGTCILDIIDNSVNSIGNCIDLNTEVVTAIPQMPEMIAKEDIKTNFITSRHIQEIIIPKKSKNKPKTTPKASVKKLNTHKKTNSLIRKNK